MSRPTRLPPELCQEVKDPCKICLQTVTLKNGIKCHGACESWVHYKCLNYTPGKIRDIRAGLITVTCPCPDCKTTVPKEYLTQEPYSCNNTQCPANNPPSCEHFDCQANEVSRCLPPRCPPPGTLRSCSQRLCREYSSTDRLNVMDPNEPCLQGYTIKTHCGDSTNSYCPASDQVDDQTQSVMEKMCKTVGDLAEQLQSLLTNLKPPPVYHNDPGPF